MNAIADTGFVIATINRADSYHKRCVEELTAFQEIYLPQTTLNEVAFMIGRKGGNLAVWQFISHLPQSSYTVLPIEPVDLARTAELLKQYADSRLDFVDASIVAIAERLKIAHILTLDYRDFGIVRPRHCDYLTLLPEQT